MYKNHFLRKNKIKGVNDLEILHKTCLIFTIIGAINWGLIGFFDFNLVTTLFKESSMIVNIIYGLVGICGLVNILLLFKHYTDDPIK